MDLHARLRSIVDPLPEGAAVTLTVDTLRRWLSQDGAGPVDLTAEEAGRLLGRASSTLRTWCGQGRIPGAYRLNGREWRIPRASLARLRDVERRKDDSDSPPDLGRWRRHLRADAGS